MSDFSQIIQEQLMQEVGGTVKIFLKGGQEITGIIMNVSDTFVVMKRAGGRSSMLALDMIGGLDIPDEELPVARNGSSHVVTPVETKQPLAHPAPVYIPPSIEPSVQQPPDFVHKVQGLLLKIDGLVSGKIQGTKIEVQAPDFTIPAEELKGPHQKEAHTTWGRIKQKYEYADRIRELGSKYGRIQPIINELRSLIDSNPLSPGLKRHLAYFLYVSGNVTEALKSYKEAGVISQASQDWHNVAALAIQANQDALACYALEQVFKHGSIKNHQSAWYVYVGLLQKTGDAALLNRDRDPGSRALTQDEEKDLLGICIYLCKQMGKEESANSLARDVIRGKEAKQTLHEAFKQLVEPLSAAYQLVTAEMQVIQHELVSRGEAQQEALRAQAAEEEKRKLRVQAPVVISAAGVTPQQLDGAIYTYKVGKNFGFLYGSDERSYFFHRSAIIDEDLLDRVDSMEELFLSVDEYIPVVFETAQGPKGPVAVGISLLRSADEIFQLAQDYADEGEYAKAITQVRRVLAVDPKYPGAQEAHEKWREYARVAVVPRGTNPYAHAKRVLLIEKDLERAVELFYIAIKENDNLESAVKDLAALLVRMDRSQEAVQLLEQHRKRISDQQSVDNLLIQVYQKAGQYDQAIILLEKNLGHASTREKRAQILGQIANCHLRLENYIKAEQLFREVIKLGIDSKTAQRNIAFSLIKQNRYDEAEQILNELLNTSPDEQAAVLLEAVAKARETGQSAQVRVDTIITETTLSDFSREMSGFTKFFLDRCVYQGVRPERVQQRNFDRSVVRSLEDLATKLGSRNPRERSEYYLSAAKIVSFMEDWNDPNQLYKYLCRSFASRGDASVIENRPLDAAREWYCEALSAYDGDHSHSGDEQDPVNALVRYLYATIGAGYIPMTPHLPSYDETLEEILRLHPQRNKIFDAIAYVVMRSRFAARHVLSRLYAKSTIQAMTLQYFKSCGIAVPSSTLKQEEFIRLWNELLRKRFDELRTVSAEMRFIANVELTEASIESRLGRLKEIGSFLSLDLDYQRLGQLQKILETALDLCKQVAFEEQERFCTQIGTRCQDLLREIEESPTKLSVEEMYLIVDTIQKKTAAHLEEIYASSVPQLTLRLPLDLESYAPDVQQKIEVQIVVANRVGCSPAESLELIVQEDSNFFTVGVQEIKLDGSLRGNEQEILRVPIRVNEQALTSEAFSLPVYAQYRTRSGETQHTPIENFSIRLYAAGQVEKIENPYAAYAKGGIVGDQEMFYGRAELITNVANAIREARSQSKSVVIFGQKRAGKSSILCHLKEELSKDPDLLILDVGNIGSLLDEYSTVPLLYQILRSILMKLEYAIEDQQERGRTALALSFPGTSAFYTDPSPLLLFRDVFERFRRAAARAQDWHNVRVVLLIDEFSYIYGQIMNGRISEDFMKNWKALLQENLFSTVLVGQDVMPKFKERFPNEFGTTQDVRVNYLDYDDAVRLIDEPLRIGGRGGDSRYREKALDRIVALTAGNPFYIQITCNRLVEYMNHKHAKLVTEADVEQVKNELIRGNNPLGWDDFDNLTSSGDTALDAISAEDARKVLATIAENSRTGLCSRNNIACETVAPIDVVLDDLVKRDVVECEQGQYYRIRVGLFKEWLLAHREE